MTMFRSVLAAAAATLCLTLPATAHDGVAIKDAYARASSASGAVFLVIENHQTADDRLIAASSDAAMRVELHTHRQSAEGVMQMMEVPEGFVIPGDGSHALARGGDHVMLMGLKAPLNTGDTVSLTLTFERAGTLTVEVPVDNERMGGPMNGMGHAGHGMAPVAD